MGIDFSHCDAHWAYGGFMRFRIRLASEIGMDLDSMEGFKKDGGGKSWSKVKDHSDCDGHLTPEECKVVAPRLKELIADWDDNNYDKQNALDLISGMEEAMREKETLLFT